MTSGGGPIEVVDWLKPTSPSGICIGTSPGHLFRPQANLVLPGSPGLALNTFHILSPGLSCGVLAGLEVLVQEPVIAVYVPMIQEALADQEYLDCLVFLRGVPICLQADDIDTN